MKYPITPEYMAKAPKEIVKLFNDLEDDIIADICRRISTSGAMTESAIHQIKVLQRQGFDSKDIEKKIRKTLRISQKKLNEIWNDAVERNREYYAEPISKLDLIESSASVAELDAQIDAIKDQTLGEFKNLTQSMGFAWHDLDGKVRVLPIGELYRKILDDAEIQLSTGAKDYNTAIKNGVRKLADGGLQWVSYESGWHNRIEVATRRAVMTGVTQISRQYTEHYSKELETEFFEVSAHQGARDVDGEFGWENHKRWQGKVYHRGGATKVDGISYADLEDTTGLGDGAGLCGWNCRHMYYPFFPGISERTYTDRELANIDKPPFKYQGQEYTAYQATQMQRKLEYAMRMSERRRVAYKSAGMQNEYNAENARYLRLREEYSVFSSIADLREQMERVSVVKSTIQKSSK